VVRSLSGDVIRRATVTDWSNDELASEAAAYELGMVAAGLKPVSVHSAADYARRFLRWRIGDYRPRTAVGPTHARSFGRVDIAGLNADLVAYEAELADAKLRPKAVRTYRGEAGRFVRWLEGSYVPGGPRLASVGHAVAPRTTRHAIPSSSSPEAAVLLLGEVVDQWRSIGGPSQAGIKWPKARWLAALKQHEDLLLTLCNPLERAAVAAVCAEAVTDAPSAERAFVAAMVWGYGRVGYGRDRTMKVLTDTPRSADRLLAAARTLAEDGALAAYRRLAGDCRLKWLGPAFGTKYLFFCQPPGQTPTALILDATVSEWFGLNAGILLKADVWSLSVYAAYLDQMHRWADELHCRAEDVELAIFRAMARTRRNSQWSE
jgi:hypothetical protein